MAHGPTPRMDDEIGAGRRVVWVRVRGGDDGAADRRQRGDQDGRSNVNRRAHRPYGPLTREKVQVDV